jgi:type II secretory pathway pseudopilin PulG
MSNKVHSKQKSRRHLSQPHSGDRTNGLQIALGLRTPRRISARLRSRHSALTLVELLVTIGLITVVSSMFLVAYRAAATEASNIRTQGTIRKISEVLMARMQEYENYPINFVKDASNTYSLAIPEEAKEVIPATDTEFESKGILVERLRVMILRDIMAQEMPDNRDDIKTTTTVMRRYWTGLAVPRPNIGPLPIFTSGTESPRAARLRTRLTQARADWYDWISNSELLYLTIEDSTLNGSSAIELFGRTEIGDTDNDGFLEFLDAYRQPIQWVRWPTGFPETIRFHPDLLDPSFNVDGFAANVMGDPIDSRRSDPGYRLREQQTKIFRPSAIAFPLVISPGPDKFFGLRFALDAGLQVDAQAGYRLLAGKTSATEVQMPVPYDQRRQFVPLIMTDPWFPRNDPTLRLGAIINAKFYEDDITNYAIYGAYQ